MQQQNTTLEQTIRDALGPTVRSAMAAVTAADEAMARLRDVQQQLRDLFPQLIIDAAAAGRYFREKPKAPSAKKAAAPAPTPAKGKAKKRVRSNEPIVTWKADKRARRVPLFVIEATGLDTKRKIIDRYGDGATFHKGQPLPKPKLAAVPKAAPKKKAAPAKKAAPKKAPAKKAPKAAAAPPQVPSNANGLAASVGA